MLLTKLCPQVYNVNDIYGPEAQLPVDININMAKVMGVFLAQLRLVPVFLLLYMFDSNFFIIL